MRDWHLAQTGMVLVRRAAGGLADRAVVFAAGRTHRSAGAATGARSVARPSARRRYAARTTRLTFIASHIDHAANLEQGLFLACSTQRWALGSFKPVAGLCAGLASLWRCFFPCFPPAASRRLFMVRAFGATGPVQLHARCAALLPSRPRRRLADPPCHGLSVAAAAIRVAARVVARFAGQAKAAGKAGYSIPPQARAAFQQNK
jgi:hypothetical protein